VAEAINGRFGKNWARVADGRRIEIRLPDTSGENVSRVLAQIEDLKVSVHEAAKVVVNERTGTIVMGQNVGLSACSILHGNLAIEITTQFQVSQPQAVSQGQATVVPQTTVRAKEGPTKSQIQKLKKAAQEFEGVLLSTWLEEMQKSSLGSPDAGWEPGAETLRSLGTQAVALALAQRGGLGIARMIIHHFPPTLRSESRSEKAG
jgi:hypothetical protein